MDKKKLKVLTKGVKTQQDLSDLSAQLVAKGQMHITAESVRSVILLGSTLSVVAGLLCLRFAAVRPMDKTRPSNAN